VERELSVVVEKESGGAIRAAGMAHKSPAAETAPVEVEVSRNPHALRAASRAEKASVRALSPLRVQPVGFTHGDLTRIAGSTMTRATRDVVEVYQEDHVAVHGAQTGMRGAEAKDTGAEVPRVGALGTDPMRIYQAAERRVRNQMAMQDQHIAQEMMFRGKPTGQYLLHSNQLQERGHKSLQEQQDHRQSTNSRANYLT
jgi:hypothetical protein